MSGFVVEIFSSASKPGDPRVWFAEVDGQPCVVSAFGLARIFATRDEARAAAEEYRRKFLVQYNIAPTQDGGQVGSP